MNKDIHVEIPASDIGSVDKFYEKVFGWNIKNGQMPSVEYGLENPDVGDGGNALRELKIIDTIPLKIDGMVQTPVLTIQVDNVMDHLAKVEENGGKILMITQATGNVGIYALFSDTEENIMGLWQSFLKN